jgi:anthranilate phosphoribosyltransferase
VHGMDGTDEVSIAGPTYVSALADGQITQFLVKPEDAGLPEHPFGQILGGTPEANTAKMLALLAGDQSPALQAFRDAVALNAAAALLIADRTGSLKDGVAQAFAALDSGRVRATLDTLVRVSNS